MLSFKSSLAAVLLAAASACVLAGSTSPVPNDTTKFELAWLIIWVILTFALLVLAGLQMLKLPHLIKGNKIVTAVAVFMQLVCFVFLLAALGTDVWSKATYTFPGGTIIGNYGVTHSYGTGRDQNYEDYCTSDNAQGQPSGWLDWCRTIRAAGAFVILFGIIGVVVAFVLLIVSALSLVGMSAVSPAVAFVPMMANIQWICFLAIVMIWGVSGHGPLKETFTSAGSKLELGASWALAFITMIFGLVVAFFFAGGTGENIKGGTAAAGAGAAGAQQQQQQPVQWTPPQQQQQQQQAPQVVVHPTQ